MRKASIIGPLFIVATIIAITFTVGCPYIESISVGDTYKYCRKCEEPDPFSNKPPEYYISRVLAIKDGWVQYEILESTIWGYRVGEILSSKKGVYLVGSEKVDYEPVEIKGQP